MDIYLFEVSLSYLFYLEQFFYCSHRNSKSQILEKLWPKPSKMGSEETGITKQRLHNFV
jgi:hypothetical protein